MADPDDRISPVRPRQALNFFVGLCIILVLIILISQYADERTHRDEIYLRHGVAQAAER
ncbi:hypothetical protein [Aggregatilinea lenta]|uniref:hypothetical protein n=1 Tax=Aggregatilinea lenta TaxID=913108 RepID=UPI0013C356C3|nr:hypothetical protein [Aggregatilinea lenta]